MQLAAFETMESSGASLHLAQINNQAGTVNYLQVLAANIQYHQAKIIYLQTEAQRLQDSTALFVTLGGGWGKFSDALLNLH